MVNIENLSKSFGPQVLFKDATFLIGDHAKVGVIGPNGAGKSTLFKILVGEDSPDHGEIRYSKNTTLAVLRQEWLPHEGDTVLNATLRIHSKWFSAKNAMHELDPTSKEYHEAESHFMVSGGYEVEPRAKALLTGLGFSESVLGAPCDLLSGGWRMRVQLAGLLLSEPDLLLLDEPTNHLDVETIVWFENFLENYSKAFMMISHDRRLIERISTSVLEVTPPRITLWPVSFVQFEIDKAIRMEQIQGEIKNREKEIAKLQDFANRFKAKASKARQAQSKLRSSERVAEDLEKLKGSMPISSRRPAGFKIETSQRTPKTIVNFEHAVFGYEQSNPLFSLESCVIEGGRRIGVIGVNGVGKSTFLKTCAGEIRLLKGEMRKNEALSFGYFSQHRLEDLPLAQKAFDYLEASIQGISISKIRGVAAGLGLMEHDMDKAIRALSGGEKARLSLARIILGAPDVLLMDEPTNHLDIEACDAMIQGLKNYAGTVLVVSHNRDFLDQVVDQILEIQPDRAFVHFGNYTDWASRASEVMSQKEIATENPFQKSGKKTKEQKREEALARQEKHRMLKELKEDASKTEIKIEALKTEAKELDAFLTNAESPKDPSFSAQLRRRGQISTELEALEAQWLDLIEKIES